MKILTLTAIAAVATTPALAGGLNNAQPDAVIPTPAPVIAPAFSGGDWTGAYVGARLAYGKTDGKGDANGDGIDDDADSALLDANGAVGGVQAGYLYDFGQFVVGGEVALNAANIDFDGGNGSVDQLHTVKLKGGYDAGRTLVYGTVGAAHFKGSFLGSDYSETGYVVGAGVDYMLTDNVSVGGEVNYHRFDDVKNSGVDLGITTVGANVNYRF